MSGKRMTRVRAALAALYGRRGRATPRAVVRAARDPRSPLHPCFCWDDGKAAERYREDQARQLMASIRVEIRTDTTVIESVAYLRDPFAKPNEQSYISMEDLRANAKASRAAVVYECDRALAVMERVRSIAVAVGLVAPADKALASIETLRALAAKKR